MFDFIQKVLTILFDWIMPIIGFICLIILCIYYSM